MHLVGGFDREVADWAGAQLGTIFHDPLRAFGVMDGQALKGAAIFNDYYPGGNINLSYVGPGTLTRSIMRDLAAYAFKDNGVSRVTIQTRRSNRTVRKLLGEKRHGFVFEGTRVRYYDTSKDGDALCFVLFREHAKRWLEN